MRSSFLADEAEQALGDALARLQHDVAGEAIGRDDIDDAAKQIATLDIADVLERAGRRSNRAVLRRRCWPGVRPGHESNRAVLTRRRCCWPGVRPGQQSNRAVPAAALLAGRSPGQRREQRVGLARRPPVPLPGSPPFDSQADPRARATVDDAIVEPPRRARRTARASRAWARRSRRHRTTRAGPTASAARSRSRVARRRQPAEHEHAVASIAPLLPRRSSHHRARPRARQRDPHRRIGLLVRNACPGWSLIVTTWLARTDLRGARDSHRSHRRAPSSASIRAASPTRATLDGRDLRPASSTAEWQCCWNRLRPHAPRATHRHFGRRGLDHFPSRRRRRAWRPTLFFSRLLRDDRLAAVLAAAHAHAVSDSRRTAVRQA